MKDIKLKAVSAVPCQVSNPVTFVFSTNQSDTPLLALLQAVSPMWFLYPQLQMCELFHSIVINQSVNG